MYLNFHKDLAIIKNEVKFMEKYSIPLTSIINELKLEKDYRYIKGADSATIDGFDIGNSNYVVNGQDHTIDVSGYATLFRFSGYNINN